MVLPATQKHDADMYPVSKFLILSGGANRVWALKNRSMLEFISNCGK